MTTFEDKFPELTIKIQQHENLQDMHYSMWTMEKLLEDIDKYCLSKQRVRDVIEKIYPTIGDGMCLCDAMDEMCNNCHKKNYVLKNHRKVLQSKSKWNVANKDYYRNKRRNDINYRLSLALRIRMNRALNENWKTGHTIELLGCSIDRLKVFLEERFDNKMSWSNYGSYWTIDHIKPCASFDLSKPEEQRNCFSYLNLQPLEKSLNISKGTKYG